MSGLEIVASIAGVATAAIKISVSMNDVADQLGSAGRYLKTEEERVDLIVPNSTTSAGLPFSVAHHGRQHVVQTDVRYISNEMACFSQVLRLVHTSLEDSTKTISSSIIQSVLNTLPQLLSQCSTVYSEASDLMLSLTPSPNPGSSSLTDSLPFFKRLRFIFQKSRISVLRSLLDSSKSTLNLLLVTLNIEMAKTKNPNKQLMDQLQSERKVFIRVVASQNRALSEALSEVEKAKKETTKLRSKAEKEREESEKAKEKEKKNTDAGSTLMLSAPSVSQLVYTPPRINEAAQSSIMSIALSLEFPMSSSNNEKPPDPTSSFPCSYNFTEPYAPNPHDAPPPPSPPSPTPYANSYSYYTAPPPYTTTEQPSKLQPNRPTFEKRLFTDPGPTKPEVESERARSHYGFTPTPKDEVPNVKRKPASNSTQAPEDQASSPNAARGRKPYTYTYQSYQPSAAQESNIPTPESKKERKPYTYAPPPPPPPIAEGLGDTMSPKTRKASHWSPPNPPSPKPAYEPFTYQFPASSTQSPYATPRNLSAGGQPYNHYSKTAPPSPQPPTDYFQPAPTPTPSSTPALPLQDTTYIALFPYTTHEIGHLTLAPFDILVDVSSYTIPLSTLPYPTHSDPIPQVHYWQASLHHRRGPRGLFPHDVVCAIDDEKVVEKVKEGWFGGGAGMVADVKGRVWLGPKWEWVEPKRRRSKWWASEF